MYSVVRREFLKRAVGALAFSIGGAKVMLTPQMARAQAVPMQTLRPDQAALFDALGETLVPGARHAGITHFIDQQISGPPEQALIEARILDIRPPYADFYRAIAASINSTSKRLYGGPFAEIPNAAQTAFVQLMIEGKVEPWQGPPAPFAYFVLRSDAVDVVYGTVDGYEMLGIPYMPHIPPRTRW